MAWPRQLTESVEIVLRVSPLFALDSIFKGTFLVPWISEANFYEVNKLGYVVLSIFSGLGAVILFILPRQQLFSTFKILLSLGIFCASYWYNSSYIDSTSTKETWMSPTLIFNMSLQIIFAYCYNNLALDHNRNQTSWMLPYGQIYTGRLTYLCFLIPIICDQLQLSSTVVNNSPLLSLVILKGHEVLAIVVHNLQGAVVGIFRTCRGIMIMRNRQEHDLFVFIEEHWVRLRVPTVLRVFWLMRTSYQLVYFYASHVIHTNSGFLAQNELMDLFCFILVSGCETVISLLGMTSVVSLINHHIGLFCINFLQIEYEGDRKIGTMAAMLFFILALQTGLMGMEPEARLVRLGRNFCLLCTAILHFVHGMVHTQLMDFTASQFEVNTKHRRALAVCAVLVVFPAVFLWMLWSCYSVSTWLLAVTAFCIEVIIKVIISLLIYTLFMIDTYQEVFWEKLDDYVYYIRATGNTIEFVFGIFLFCNGAYIMVFESGSMIRAVMMCIHAYFNIWLQAQEGWKVFLKRRTAVSKINMLPLATVSQLQEYNDVCAICYQELVSARVTRCHHIFHNVCLRKWLYVQESCPLCHEPIYETKSARKEGDADDANREVPFADDRLH